MLNSKWSLSSLWQISVINNGNEQIFEQLFLRHALVFADKLLGRKQLPLDLANPLGRLRVEDGFEDRSLGSRSARRASLCSVLFILVLGAVGGTGLGAAGGKGQAPRAAKG